VQVRSRRVAGVPYAGPPPRDRPLVIEGEVVGEDRPGR
jgi:hypothetical protein